MKKETPRTWHSGPPAPQGAAASRVWNAGPPPHVGWWNASIAQDENAWRWWNGVQWSRSAMPGDSAREACAKALRPPMWDAGDKEWTDYWPEGARVPRVDPANPYITPMLPALNAGSLYAWEEAGHRMRVEPDPTPEKDEAWRAISTGQPQEGKMNYSGTICKLNNPKGANFGRLVRVLLPVQPGETYGEGRVFSAQKNPEATYYSFTPVDGQPLQGKRVSGEKFESMVLVARDIDFDIIEEAGEELK